MTAESTLAAQFQEHRDRLLAIATRVLANRSDAEDVVQEAWVRLSRQPPGSVENLAGWLTTVVGRLSIDVLRSRTAKGEVSYDAQPWYPVVTADDDGLDDPADSALRAESLGLALLVVLGSLRPDERLAFVLHDLFGVPFAEIGPIIDKSADAAKMTASRARRKVQGAAPRPTDSLRGQRRVVDAFLAAAREGDFEALLEILDPDVTWELHGARASRVKGGRDELVRALGRGGGLGYVARRVMVDGRPGIVAWGPTGRLVSVMACTVENGRMTRIASLTDRARLREVDVPGPTAEA